MKTIGDRIKEKRKEMGLTQLQLAERLGVTDRAVSKWEQNEGNPDFSILPALANTLGMTLDYLISGVEPAVNLEDMDAEKRAFYLIDKDDGENFVKYGYPKPYILFDDTTKSICGYANRAAAGFETKIRDAVYSGRKPKVFDALIKSYLTFDKNQKNNMLYNSLSSASLFYDCLDDFVILCALSGRTDILDEIGFKFFAIGDRKSANRDFQYAVDDPKSTYLISEETLRLVLTSEDVPEKTKRYIAEIEFLQPAKYPKPERIAFLADRIVAILYESKQYDLLKIALERMTKNALDSKNVICEGGEYMGKVYFRVEHPFHNETRKIPLAVIPGIDIAIQIARQNNDVEWLKTFSAYNATVNGIYGDLHEVVSQDELEMHRTQANPKSTYSEILISKFTRLELIAFGDALTDWEHLDDSDPIHALELALKNLKKNYEIIKDLPICYPELFRNMVERKDMKALFALASNYGLSTLQDEILTGDGAAIMKWVNSFFASYELPKDVFDKYKVGEEEKKQIYAMRQRQSHVCPIPKEDAEPIYGTPEYVKKKKTLVYDRFKDELEGKLERLTQSKRREENFKRISAEITPELLLKKLDEGDEDGAVVKLCTLLEATLQYRFRYDGELFAMIDAYFKDHLQEQELHNLWDDEDNNYYQYKKEDEETVEENKRRERVRGLLHKLRMRRNHILHPAAQDVAITREEIKQCISIVKNI